MGSRRNLGDAGRSGGVVSRHLDDLDAVLKFDALGTASSPPARSLPPRRRA